MPDKDGLYYDPGAYLLRRTGNEHIDGFFDSLSEHEPATRFSPGNPVNAGAIFNGKLLANTHYPDIRGLEICNAIKREACSIIENRSVEPVWNRPRSLEELAGSHFGSEYTEQLFRPIVTHFFKSGLDVLSGHYLRVIGLDRMVAHSEDEWAEVCLSTAMRDVFAYPDQKNIPFAIQNKARTRLYPKRGMAAWISLLVKWLEGTARCEICLDAAPLSVSLNARNVGFLDSKGELREIGFDTLIFTTGLFSSSRLFDFSREIVPEKPFETVPHTAVHVAVPSSMKSDLSYIMNHDTTQNFYRVTNYRASSQLDSDARVTLEFMGTEFSRADLDEAMTTLLRHGLIDGDGAAAASPVSVVKGNFPVLTLQACRFHDVLADPMRELERSGIFALGTRSGRPLFFADETLEATESIVSGLL